MPSAAADCVAVPLLLDNNIQTQRAGHALKRCLRGKQHLPQAIIHVVDASVSQWEDEALSSIAPLPNKVAAAPRTAQHASDCTAFMRNRRPSGRNKQSHMHNACE